MLTNQYSEIAMDCQISIPDFLNHLFSGIRGENYFELTLILPEGVTADGPRVISKGHNLARRERPEWDWVTRMNRSGYGVYYATTLKRRRIAAGGRSKEQDASWCSALWVDIDMDSGDYKSKEDAYRAICDFTPVATVIIDSGGGLHALWRITPIKVDSITLPQLKQTLKGLAMALKGDPHVAELARVLRLPGTINTKPKRNNAPCEVVYFLDGETDYREFDDVTRLAAFRSAPYALPPLPDGIRLQVPAWVSEYVKNGAAQGTRNNRLFAASIEYRVNGLSRIEATRDLGGRARADGLDDEEIERTIDSAWRSDLGAPNVAPHIAVQAAINAKGARRG